MAATVFVVLPVVWGSAATALSPRVCDAPEFALKTGGVVVLPGGLLGVMLLRLLEAFLLLGLLRCR